MLPGLGALAAFAVASRDGARLEARFAARGDNKVAMERFREAATKHRDVESLLKDRRTLQVVLEAFQLEGEIDKRGILRKILTEDPTAEGALANRLTDRRWRELASAFATRQAVGLTTAQMAAMTTTQLATLTPKQVAGLTSDQARALSSGQVAALTTVQLRALGAAAVAALDLPDVRALGSTQVAALRPGQIAALSPMQVAVIDPGEMRQWGAAQVRALSSTQVATLGTSQVAALGTAQLAAMSFEQSRGLTDRQRAALGTAQIASIGRASLQAEAAVEAAAAAEASAASPFAADPALLDRIVAGAITNRYEKAMGDGNEGLREALYFVRNAPKVTSVVALMEDRAMTAVVRGALGLPDSFGLLSYDQQKTMLTARLDVTKLQDTREVSKMAQRYLALAATPSGGGSASVAALFSGGDAASAVASLAARRISFTA
jgi:hypothetical protein